MLESVEKTQNTEVNNNEPDFNTDFEDSERDETETSEPIALEIGELVSIIRDNIDQTSQIRRAAILDLTRRYSAARKIAKTPQELLEVEKAIKEGSWAVKVLLECLDQTTETALKALSTIVDKLEVREDLRNGKGLNVLEAFLSGHHDEDEKEEEDQLPIDIRKHSSEDH